MSDKKLYTRSEFENMRTDSAKKMSQDNSLYKDALDVFVRADRYSWIHQTSWFGEPVLNLPQDMFAIQEIIFQTKPKYIIEVGVAWGGGLLFYSTLMEALGGQKVIGIDVYIPDDLKERLFSHGKISDRLVLINQSSTDPQTINQIESIIGQSRDVLVLLDSFHTHDHVLTELKCILHSSAKANIWFVETLLWKTSQLKHTGLDLGGLGIIQKPLCTSF